MVKREFFSLPLFFYNAIYSVAPAFPLVPSDPAVRQDPPVPLIPAVTVRVYGLECVWEHIKINPPLPPPPDLFKI